MPKRLTDTEKWKKPFIRSLPPEYKIFWLYIVDDCDHAGIWHIDMEVAEIRLGSKLSLDKARGLFNGKVVEFDSGTKWFIPDFITFQYGVLTEKNKMYNSVISQLEKYDLMGHLSPIYGGKVQDKEKVKVMEKDSFGESENLLKTIYRIEDCLRVALNDDRWTRANKTNEKELQDFNHYLEKQGIYTKNPADYKQYFAKLKGKYPDLLKREMTTEELRAIAREMDKNTAA